MSYPLNTYFCIILNTTQHNTTQHKHKTKQSTKQKQKQESPINQSIYLSISLPKTKQNKTNRIESSFRSLLYKYK
jgi:hypothetical protein